MSRAVHNHITAKQAEDTHKKTRCDRLADAEGNAPDRVLLLSLLVAGSTMQTMRRATGMYHGSCWNNRP